MAEFILGAAAPPPRNATEALDRIPHLGNAGAKIGAVIDSVFNADVGGDIPNAAEKKVLEKVGVLPFREAKAVADFMLGEGRTANPASAELPPGMRPDGTMGPTFEQIAEQQAARAAGSNAPVVNMLPMWNADP